MIYSILDYVSDIYLSGYLISTGLLNMYPIYYVLNICSVALVLDGLLNVQLDYLIDSGWLFFGDFLCYFSIIVRLLNISPLDYLFTMYPTGLFIFSHWKLKIKDQDRWILIAMGTAYYT